MVETHAGPLRPPDEAEPAIAPEPPAGATRGAAATPEDGPAASPEADAEALPSRVFLVTPNDWVHLDLSGDALANARRLVDRITVGAPADQAKLKLRMAAALQGAVRDALRQGAFMAAFYSHLVEGTAVGASMVVAVRPLPRDVVQDGRVDMARAVRSVAGAVQGGDQVYEAGPLELPAGPAFRVHKAQVVTAMGARHETVVVQYFVPVPGRLAVVVATFSTPTVEVAGSMVALFDAMAATLRWRA